ncbi:hypothetical protein B0H63DRAFT_490554 [Podospora didyma]|uniref:DUF7924 domain-containing protein n=1 Tax=Podospora didyma TaxID=330526 RepID=A0AAE0N0V1_9PEZI|nr:hypothetical protein B0H63DRAFT_490554 [Podospora didyma]
MALVYLIVHLNLVVMLRGCWRRVKRGPRSRLITPSSFLTSEVKFGAPALDIADRQNAHSMTLAVRSTVELFHAVRPSTVSRARACKELRSSRPVLPQSAREETLYVLVLREGCETESYDLELRREAYYCEAHD